MLHITYPALEHGETVVVDRYSEQPSQLSYHSRSPEPNERILPTSMSCGTLHVPPS